MRPAEVDRLGSHPAKVRTELGWERTVSLEEMVV
jgi:GDP-D-mannose dehydratase